MKAINMVGSCFGKWEVIIRDGNLYGRPAFLCKCVCGLLKTVSGNELRRGKTISCRACSKLKLNSYNGRHYKDYPEYFVWQNMKARCYNKNVSTYIDYGGRGISVCDKWKNNFLNFIKDMGQRPSKKHSLDRINNGGNYTPDNCKWSTAVQQNNNRRQKKSTYISFVKNKKLYKVTIRGIYVGYLKTKEEAIILRNNYILKNNICVRLKDSP